jgi:hypothetical protein
MADDAWSVASPDGKTVLVVERRGGKLWGRISHDGRLVVSLPALGLTRRDQAFVDFKDAEAGTIERIDQTYTMLHGKRRLCRDHATERAFLFSSGHGGKVELRVRAQNDGVAFRYRFPEKSRQMHTIVQEHTQFGLPERGRVWAHPYDKATEYTPAYETYYVDGAAVGTSSRDEEGWAFPLLFCNEDKTRWGLITEAGLDGSYCGCRLAQKAPGGVYSIRFPSEDEGNGTGSVAPCSTLPWATPWRVIILGDSLGDIVESTLVTDVSRPSIVQDTSWIKPGRASWSWLSDHDSPQDFDKLTRFVDLAAEMGWEYSLVDANWTIMKHGTIHDLIAYADSRGIGLLLWYNSGGPHNFVSEMPRGLMYFEKIRRKEFKRLRDWGIKGVKVDFFQSDKQNVIRLYHDILKDAAEFQIMVNFHGCTLPRGWSRTYPHLMTMEAVRGEECYSFDRRFPEEAPVHNTIIPFTRNAVGPMDYTPVMFEDNRYPHRTTYAHELALPIVFESGWLHFADAVGPYRSLPETAKEFLKNVPVAWNETRLLAGEPGEYVVLARRHAHAWYIGGINGRDSARTVSVPLSSLGGVANVTLIQDGPSDRTFDSSTRTVHTGDGLTVQMRSYGGFVAMLDTNR